MSEVQAEVEVSGRALLIKWAEEQDDWVREIVATVLETNAEPSADQIEAAYKRMLVEKSLESGVKVAGPTLVDRPSAGRNDPPFGLISIAAVKNVNALAAGQDISFNPKMTVIFGRNGSGKTGYARILKRLSSVRAEQKILPDISATTPVTDPPSATIRYRLGEVEETLSWTGAAGVAPFTRVDVFDAQDAPTYVDGDLTYVYAPTDVALFRHVALAVESVRGKVEAAKKEKSPGPNVFVSHFKRSVPFYATIDTLGATTDIAALKAQAQPADDEQTALEGLKETIEALSGHGVDAQVRSTQADLDLCELATKVVERLRSFDAEKRDSTLARLKAAQEKHVSASRDAFANETLPGLLSVEWKSFVEAGEQFIKSLGLKDYPSSEVECVYCRQPLTDAALTLLKKYRDYCNGALEKEVASAKAALDELHRPLLALDLRTLEESIQRHVAGKSGTEVPSHVRDAQAVLEAARRLKEGLGRPEAIGPAPTTPEVQAAFDRLAAAVVTYRDRMAALKGKAEERENALGQAISKRDIIEARARLRELMPAIEEFVARSKWVSVADGVLRRFKSVAKTLTEASKQASERLINQDFEKHFRAECGHLNAPHVDLDFKGQKGAAARRKQLRPEYRLTESLSEGEQKVIALADFLAEARLRTTKAPVVFDDPVTSLDYERIREVASRLASLARERQVVVFTHNIWFAVELLERFRDHREDCAYYDIRALDGRRGVVSGGTHPRSDSLNDLKKRINTTLAEARKASGETQDALVFRGYSVLRALCEVAVESELFHGVVRRYEPNIRLTVLTDIKPMPLQEASKAIHPVYEETCRYIEAHSQPMEHLNIVRTVDELEKDFKVVVAAVDAYKKAAA